MYKRKSSLKSPSVHQCYVYTVANFDCWSLMERLAPISWGITCNSFDTIEVERGLSAY